MRVDDKEEQRFMSHVYHAQMLTWCITCIFVYVVTLKRCSKWTGTQGMAASLQLGVSHGELGVDQMRYQYIAWEHAAYSTLRIRHLFIVCIYRSSLFPMFLYTNERTVS